MRVCVFLITEKLRFFFSFILLDNCSVPVLDDKGKKSQRKKGAKVFHCSFFFLRASCFLSLSRENVDSEKGRYPESVISNRLQILLRIRFCFIFVLQNQDPCTMCRFSTSTILTSTCCLGYICYIFSMFPSST